MTNRKARLFSIIFALIMLGTSFFGPGGGTSQSDVFADFMIRYGTIGIAVAGVVVGFQDQVR